MSDDSPMLFAGLPPPVFLPDETPRDWTADQLRATRPDVADAIESLHIAGVTYRQMQAAFRISPSTIRAVLRASGRVAQRAREGLALDFRQTSQRLVEHVNEVLDDPDRASKLGAKDAAFSASTLSERADAMQGHATQVVDVLVSDPGRDEFLRLTMGFGRGRAGQCLTAAADAGRNPGAAAGAAAGDQVCALPAGEPGTAAPADGSGAIEAEFREGNQDD